MFARLGVLTIVVMDTAMSGHASGDDLAYYAVAAAPQIPLLLVGIGLLMGTIVMTAQAVGAGNPERCGAIWRTALAHAIVAGAVMAIACAFGESFLLATGQPEDLAGRRRSRAGGARLWTTGSAAVRGDELLSRRYRPPGPGNGDRDRRECSEHRPELASDSSATAGFRRSVRKAQRSRRASFAGACSPPLRCTYSGSSAGGASASWPRAIRPIVSVRACAGSGCRWGSRTDWKRARSRR